MFELKTFSGVSDVLGKEREVEYGDDTLMIRGIEKSNDAMKVLVRLNGTGKKKPKTKEKPKTEQKTEPKEEQPKTTEEEQKTEPKAVPPIRRKPKQSVEDLWNAPSLREVIDYIYHVENGGHCDPDDIREKCLELKAQEHPALAKIHDLQGKVDRLLISMNIT